MFKEIKLVFEELPGESAPGDRGKTAPLTPESVQQVLGTTPAKQKSPERLDQEKTDDILMAFYGEIIRNGDTLFIGEYNKALPAVETKFREHIAAKLKDGYTFEKFESQGLQMTWNKDGKKITEANPVFAYPELAPHLSQNTQHILENTEQAAAKKDFLVLITHLKSIGEVSQSLSESQILDSDFAQDVLPIINASHQLASLGHGPGYSRSHVKHEIHFKPSAEMFKAGGRTMIIDLKEYDENLVRISETPQQKAETFLQEEIMPLLREQRSNLSDSQINSSYLVTKELRPILTAGFEARKPYLFRTTDVGFNLDTPDNIAFLNQTFDLDTAYDENLNPYPEMKPERQVVEADRGKGDTEEEVENEINPEKKIFDEKEQRDQAAKEEFPEVYEKVKRMLENPQTIDNREIGDVLREIWKLDEDASKAVAALADVDHLVGEQRSLGKPVEIDQRMQEKMNGTARKIFEQATASNNPKTLGALSLLEDLGGLLYERWIQAEE